MEKNNSNAELLSEVAMYESPPKRSCTNSPPNESGFFTMLAAESQGSSADLALTQVQINSEGLGCDDRINNKLIDTHLL